MGKHITENPRILADIVEPEKKRKNHEMSECCVVMGSSKSNCKEQQLLEAAAFHLILLSNPLQQSYDSDDGCTGNSGSHDVGFRMIMGKKKRIQEYGLEDINVKPKNDRDVKSVTSSSSSSSSAETIKSGISSVSMEENEGRVQRLQHHRLRSIVDIYHVTRRL
ncbi:unnamed protein product [Lactuca virosa]|uniref:Uncharacterized protein n=1 Tax=Lactuca virosa TaxID=75947 RepID=A0AAU9MKA8_9ASTR|nr:unnamed protein product [Lactuca virosa]